MLPKEKSEIITQVCAISGFHKKHAIRLLNQDSRSRIIKIESRGRPQIYHSIYTLTALSS